MQSIEDQIQGDPNFWNDPEKNASVLKEKKRLEDKLAKASFLEKSMADLDVALELAEEGEEFLKEAVDITQQIEKALDSLEVESVLSSDEDEASALLTINAGAGGTESCDWAEMLLRMYLRFVQQQGWQGDIHDFQPGDEAGLRSVSVEVAGRYAYGFLKAEIGVHRLVRISPFDSSARRHTSFASVFVTPIIEDGIDVEINPSDLRIDTYRASGAGGQHVNRTDSAVRITHEPTGIVVQCQSQRSQHQNRDTAMKMLRARLYELEMEQRRKKLDEIESAKSEIGFGSQIRSYVLHPYKMVKDHRTEMEDRNPNLVLDGNIEHFIKKYLYFKFRK